MLLLLHATTAQDSAPPSSQYEAQQASKLNKHLRSIRPLDEDLERSLSKRLERLSAINLIHSPVLCVGARLGGEVRAFHNLRTAEGEAMLAIGVDFNPGTRNAFVLWGDAHHLQFNDHIFHTLFINILDHVKNVTAFALEARRVLAPGSVLMVDMDGNAPDRWSVRDLRKSKAELVAEIQEAGFMLLQNETLIGSEFGRVSYGKSYIFRTASAGQAGDMSAKNGRARPTNRPAGEPARMREASTGLPTLLDQLRSKTSRYQVPFQDDCAVDNTPALKRLLRCDLCQWQPPDLLQALSPFASMSPSEALKAALSQQRTKQSSLMPKLSWFICLTNPSKPQAANQSLARGKRAVTGKRQQAMLAHAKAAVLSALLNAPSLVPHVVYMHHAQQTLEHDEFTNWLQSLGVRVILHRLSFAGSLQKGIHPISDAFGTLRFGSSTLDIGTFCRMDIPAIAHNLSMAEDWAARGIDRERLLYTDTDVLFAGDVDALLALPRPRTFLAGTEVFSQTNINAGVMLMNLTAMLSEWPLMLEYGRQRRFRFKQPTQSWITEWFLPSYKINAAFWEENVTHLTGWHPLEDALWNARAFAHGKGATPHGPHIWHWHGFKAADVECWLARIGKDGVPCAPSSSAGDSCQRLSPAQNISSLALIKGSSCPQFTILNRFLGGCALRTYVYLLGEFLRFTSLAGAMGF